MELTDTAKRQFRFGIDPGSTCIEAGTIIPPKGTFLGRCLSLIRSLEEVFSRFENLGEIAEIAIEEFVDYTPKEKARGIRKADRVAGVCLCLAWHWTRKVIEIGKGAAPKTEAVMLCRALKIEVDSQDAADAVHLGLLCGWGEKTS